MKARQLRRIVEDKYTAYAQKVVEEIKAIGPESLTAPADLGLTDVWEEFKSQVQGEESLFYEAYVETIESICRDVIARLTEAERRLLWLETDAYFDFDAVNPQHLFPAFEEVGEAVANELYSQVWSLAADEEMQRSGSVDDDPSTEE